MAAVRVILFVASLVLAACGGDEVDDTGGTGTTPATADTTTTAEPPATAEATTTIGGDDESACSAAGRDVNLVEQPDLPDVVAAIRRDIAEVAADCEFEALADIAQQGGQFTYSFGDEGDPAEFWRRQEAAGREPLRFLVELLDRPYGVVEDDGTKRYAWPSAFTYDSWQQVPEADRDALRPLYGEEDFADFATAGGYIGYRVVITDSGDWTTFVAGD